jgi:hypothetical protein
MSLLPNAANAALDDAKIVDYLLEPSHPVGGGKAKFFLSRGFTRANWMELKRALLAQNQSLCHFGMDHSAVRPVPEICYRIS